VQRAPGWISLAGIALELAALAFVAHVVMGAPEPAPSNAEAIPADDVANTPEEQPTSDRAVLEPMEFIRASADEGARYYRAADAEVDVIAGFYSDGRLRLADATRRFAGMLQNGRADLLELQSNQWSEVFVRETPAGTIQLELRGGPYDAHVLTCETLD
jgi:hypothetical protein